MNWIVYMPQETKWIICLLEALEEKGLPSKARVNARETRVKWEGARVFWRWREQAGGSE
jgi:hypothetical protein